MSKPVITVKTTDTTKIVNDLLNQNRIRSLPVLTNDKLVGIITDRDIKQASVSESTSLEPSKIAYLNTRVPVSALMTENVVTVSPDTTLDEVAKILLEHKISGAPVIDEDGSLVGMITQGDIFRLLISLTGVESNGIQIAVQISTETGTVKEIANTIRSNGGRIGSLLTSYEDVPAGFRNAYFKTFSLDTSKMNDLIAQLEEKAKILYIIEHFEADRPRKTWLMNI